MTYLEIVTTKLSAAEDRVAELAAELALEKQLHADVTVNNVTFIKQIRRLQSSEEEQNARIRELEAALREIAGYEKSSLEVENAFAASLCGKARVALTSQMETPGE